MKGISGREWVLLSDLIRPSEELLKHGEVIAQVLANRNFDEHALDLKLKDLLPPELIPNMEEAVYRITKSVKDGKRIILYGDYDVDGITGSALLYDFLKTAGAKVSVVLPTRKTGYGLNKELVELFSRYGELLITVDNGTTAIEELKNSKIETIVLDHHNPQEELPNALVVNPKIDESTPSELKEVSSVSLCFYLVAMLRKELGVDVDIRDYLYLTAIGTVADVMPLNPLNRILVKNGIRLLNHIAKGGNTKAYGIKAMLEGLGIKEITARDIGFYIAPRLNAPGRVSNPYVALKLLLAKDIKTARLLYKKVEEYNEKRKRITNLAYEKAISQIDKDRNFIVVRLEEWAGGVAGIVAGRLSNTFGKPSAVFSVRNDLATASVRSVEGINIYQVLKKFSDLYIKWGGHSYAAGLTLRREDLKTFENLMEEALLEVKREEPKLYIDTKLETYKIDQYLIDALKSLEPYGEGFPEPVFLSEPLVIERVERINGKLIVKISSGLVFSNFIDLSIPSSLIHSKRRIAFSIDTKSKALKLIDLEA